MNTLFTTSSNSTPDSTEFKSLASTTSIDEKKGIVEAFVAGIGNRDSVGDIIIPGAFNESLKHRKPRVCWGHDWNHPIGKVLEIFEVGPDDPRLPMKMKEAGIGGLFARVQFNLKSQKGKDAFENILFYDTDQEWCVDDQTEILTNRGWLKYDQIQDGDLAYVLDPELGWGKFEEITAVNVFEDKTRKMRHIETGGFSSLTTGAHRWPLVSNHNGGNVKWTTTEELDYQARIPRSAPRFDAPVVQKYDDSFVELVGWFWTEGWVPPADHTDSGLYIAQSAKVNPEKVASIRAAFEQTFPGMWSEAHSKDEMARFRVPRSAANEILAVTGEGKAPSPDFLTNLTRSQLNLLIDICIQGDGSQSGGITRFYQVNKNGNDAFQMLCALAGRATNTLAGKDYGNRYGTPPDVTTLLKNGVAKPLDAIRVKNTSGKKSRTTAVDKWIEKDGIVWCPSTPSTTWLARRNGSVYFTGNSIGYKTLKNRFDNDRKANILEVVELYEVSPVLHGANQLTATIDIKSEDPDLDGSIVRGISMLVGFALQNVEWANSVKSLDPDTLFEGEVKVGAPSNIQAVQDAVGGDVLQGRGPHRGGLSDLLDYWRPIMKKPGGFRRCLVILADHPELGPLPNLCAWLHHETTGKWPNEGHGKSEESNEAFGEEAVLAKNLSTHFGGEVRLDSVIDNVAHFQLKQGDTLQTFNANFTTYGTEGTYLFGNLTPVDVKCDSTGTCECETEEKVGRRINRVNLSKLQQVYELLGEILESGETEEMSTIRKKTMTLSGFSDIQFALDTINEFHKASAIKSGDKVLIEIESEEHEKALRTAMTSLERAELIEGVE